MTKEQELELMAYHDALNGANKRFVIALMECVELLSKYPPPSENPGNWKKMLNDLEGMTALTEDLLEKDNHCHIDRDTIITWHTAIQS